MFVSGGSMASLTALTAARDNRLREDEWSQGVAYVSDQTHSSVAKGLHIIGFRADQVRKIPTDSQFRMDIDALKQALKQDIANGKKPFAVIATAGTTNTGASTLCRRLPQSASSTIFGCTSTVLLALLSCCRKNVVRFSRELSNRIRSAGTLTNG